MISSIDMLAAVDRDLGACDIDRVVAAQKEDRAGDVRGYPEAVERNARQQYNGLGSVRVALHSAARCRARQVMMRQPASLKRLMRLLRATASA